MVSNENDHNILRNVSKKRQNDTNSSRMKNNQSNEQHPNRGPQNKSTLRQPPLPTNKNDASSANGFIMNDYPKYKLRSCRSSPNQLIMMVCGLVIAFLAIMILSMQDMLESNVNQGLLLVDYHAKGQY